MLRPGHARSAFRSRVQSPCAKQMQRVICQAEVHGCGDQAQRMEQKKWKEACADAWLSWEGEGSGNFEHLDRTSAGLGDQLRSTVKQEGPSGRNPQRDKTAPLLCPKHRGGFARQRLGEPVCWQGWARWPPFFLQICSDTPCYLLSVAMRAIQVSGHRLRLLGMLVTCFRLPGQTSETSQR